MENQPAVILSTQKAGASSPPEIPSGILILCAIRMEENAIRNGVFASPSSPVSAAIPIQIRAVGIGATRLPMELPSADTLIILAGLAGGISPRLSIGDVVIDPADHDPSWIEQLRLAMAAVGLNVTVAPIANVSRPLVTVVDKQAVFQGGHAVAVEMEHHAVRQWLNTSGRKASVLHIRVISDSATDAIDPRVLHLVDELGRPRASAILRYLLGHPLKIPALIRLGTQSNRAARNLTVAVQTVIEHLWPGDPIPTTPRQNQVSGIVRYFAKLSTGRFILWCYFIYWVIIAVRYFDPRPRIWITSLGLSGIIGFALYVNTRSGSQGRGIGFWPTFRLFLTPFCVSSFAALVKERHFILIFAPRLEDVAVDLSLAVTAWTLLLAAKWVGKRFASELL